MKGVFLKVVGVAVLAVVAVSVWFWQDYQSYLQTPLNIKEEQVFEVKKGSNFNAVIKSLKANKYIDSPLYIKLYARQQQLANKLKAGEYLLKPDLTPPQLLDILTSGRSISYQFTIVEGSTFKQVKAAIAENKYLQDDVSNLSNEEILKSLNTDSSNDQYTHPEGLFLAETYSFSKGSSALAVLKRSHNMLKTSLASAWESRQEKLPYKTAYEALIMASIVEKETARADERPVIAGVFTRRLEKRMRLQTDPTVIYGMGDRYKGNIRRSDLRKPTAYNTYVIPALPPTPIAMVGREAIQAALNPTSGKALFFVAKGDGSHYFSATLREHNNAVKKYQLTRRKDYRSSP